LEIVQLESPELASLLAEFKERLNELRTQVQPLLQQVQSAQLPTSNGISLLEVKFHLLLSYCINIAFYLLLKTEGRSVRDHPVIEHLVRLRVLLERIRPIDQKLRYQINKLLRLAASDRDAEAPQQSQTENPLAFRPNPSALEADHEEEEDESAGVYTVPKNIPVDLDKVSKQERQKERKKKLALGSSMMEFIREEYDEAPETISFGVGRTRDEEEEERQRYEEEHFVRLGQSKKERKKKEKQQLHSGLEDIGDYNELAGLIEEDKDADEEEVQAYLKSKRSFNTTINQLEKKKKQTMGDDDLPYRDAQDRRAQKHKLEQFLQEEIPSDEDELRAEADGRKKQKKSELDEVDDSEDEFYKQVAKSQKRKREKSQDSQAPPAKKPKYREEPTVQEGEKRKITYEIEKNRGLMRQRNKKLKNPRKKLRVKFDKAKTANASQGHRKVDKSKVYTGERSIRTDLVRSVSLK